MGPFVRGVYRSDHRLVKRKTFAKWWRVRSVPNVKTFGVRRNLDTSAVQCVTRRRGIGFGVRTPLIAHCLSISLKRSHFSFLAILLCFWTRLLMVHSRKDLCFRRESRSSLHRRWRLLERMIPFRWISRWNKFFGTRTLISSQRVRGWRRNDSHLPS